MPNPFSNTSSTLIVNLVSDGVSGVFAGFNFAPFTLDPNELQFLEPGTFADGVFDGAGGANIATFNLEIVPEPTSGLILLTLIPIVYCRRVR